MRGIEDRWSARDRQLRPTIPNASSDRLRIIRRRRRSVLIFSPFNGLYRELFGAARPGISNPQRADYTDRIRVRRHRSPR